MHTNTHTESTNSNIQDMNFYQQDISDKPAELRSNLNVVAAVGMLNGIHNTYSTFTLTYCKECNPTVCNSFGSKVDLVIRASGCDQNSNLGYRKTNRN